MAGAGIGTDGRSAPGAVPLFVSVLGVDLDVPAGTIFISLYSPSRATDRGWCKEEQDLMVNSHSQMEYGEGGPASEGRSSFAESRAYGTALRRPALAHLSSSMSPRPNLKDHPHARQPPKIHHQEVPSSHSRGRSHTAASYNTIAIGGGGTDSPVPPAPRGAGASIRHRSTSTPSSSSPAAGGRRISLTRLGHGDGIEDHDVVPSSSSSTSSGNISTPAPTGNKPGPRPSSGPSTSLKTTTTTPPNYPPRPRSKTSKTLTQKGPLSSNPEPVERELRAASIRDRSTSTSTSTSLPGPELGRGSTSVTSSPKTLLPATRDVRDGKNRDKSWTIAGNTAGQVSLNPVLDDFSHPGGADPETLPPQLPPLPTSLLTSASAAFKEDSSDSAAAANSVRPFSDDHHHRYSHRRDGLATTMKRRGQFSSLMDRGQRASGLEGGEEREEEEGGGEGGMRMGTGYALASWKRNREFCRVFDGLVGGGDYLIEDFSCAMQREILAQGRLYVSEMTVSFHANIFGWITTVVIPFADILSIEKRVTAFVIPNAISITTKTSEYFITSLLSRDTTFNLIQSVWRTVTRRPRSSSFNSGQSSKPFSPSTSASASNLSIPLSEEGGEIGSSEKRLIEGEGGRRAGWREKAKRKSANRKSNLGVGDGERGSNTNGLHSPATSFLEVGERKVEGDGDGDGLAGDPDATPSNSDPGSSDSSSSSSSAPSPDDSLGFQSPDRTKCGNASIEVRSGKGPGAGVEKSTGTGSDSDQNKTTTRDRKRNREEKGGGGGGHLGEKKSFLKPLVLSETPLSSTSPIPPSDGTSTICYCGRQGMHFPKVRMDKVFPGDMKKVCDLVLSMDFTVGLLESSGFGDIRVSEWRHPTHGSDSPYLHRRMSSTRISAPSDGMLPVARKCQTLVEALHTNFDEYVTVLLTDSFESVTGKGFGVDKIKFVAKTRICFMKAGGVGYGERTRVVITVGPERGKKKGPEMAYYCDLSKAYYRAFQDYLSGHLRESEGHIKRTPVPCRRLSGPPDSPGSECPDAFFAGDGYGDAYPQSFLAKTGRQAVDFLERVVDWIGPGLTGSMPAGTTNTAIWLALLIGVLILSNIWTMLFVPLHPAQPDSKVSGSTTEGGFIWRPEEVANLVQISLTDYFGDPPKGSGIKGSSDLQSIWLDVTELDSLLRMVEEHVEGLQKRRRVAVVGAISSEGNSSNLVVG